MPSPVVGRRQIGRLHVAGRAGPAMLAAVTLAALTLPGCYAGRRGRPEGEVSRFYPPAPQVPRVVALGSLRSTAPPTQAQVELAEFLFGAEPVAALTVVQPTALVGQGADVLICDSALDAVLRWEAAAGRLVEESNPAALLDPFDLAIAANGDRLICDRHGVRRIDSSGRVLCSYALGEAPFKPGGVLAIADEVWVSNLAADRIEVFEGLSGRHTRSIGARGHGPGCFGLPRGLARAPDGSVCAIDMLNNRVQVLDAHGTWLRNIGRPGDNVGSFGRPKGVAVGPDGTVFVSDAFSQRVHVFALNGQPLLAFGEPGSGCGELALPAGIAISTVKPATDEPVPAELTPAYYVLVAEQLNRPGVRVYAWLGVHGDELALPLASEAAVRWKPAFPDSVAINPHWDAQRCAECHGLTDGQLGGIAPAAVDPLCLSCHDGTKAPADPHPIGRPGVTDLVTTPPGFPTVNGAIGCLTCHDIQRHCRPDAKRPAVNAVLLREYDPQRPLEYCVHCHRSEVGGRFSPHRQRDATGRVREDACLFCHTQRPDVHTDGRRRFEPHLRAVSSELCLNCHAKHWDLSPLGHVDRPVTPRIREWMLMRELSLEIDAHVALLAELAAQPHREPARLPLGDGKVTCYTCHNPHYNGLFPPDSELGALARNAQDRISALRTDWIDLCSECHNR